MHFKWTTAIAEVFFSLNILQVGPVKMGSVRIVLGWAVLADSSGDKTRMTPHVMKIWKICTKIYLVNLCLFSRDYLLLSHAWPLAERRSCSLWNSTIKKWGNGKWSFPQTRDGSGSGARSPGAAAERRTRAGNFGEVAATPRDKVYSPASRSVNAPSRRRSGDTDAELVMDPRYDIQWRGAGGSGAGSPALTGAQARRRKMPPRPADYKLQVIIIGSRGVGKTSLMERFTDDTFCEACKSTVGEPVGDRWSYRGVVSWGCATR